MQSRVGRHATRGRLVKHLLNSRLQPPTFGPAVVLTITILWVTLTFVRGADYFFNDTPGTIAGLLLDLDFGLKRLGVCLMVSAALFFAAVLSRRHIAVWGAHALLAAAYLGMSQTVAGAVFTYGAGPSHLIAPIGGLVWHVLMMCLMGVMPKAPKEVRRAAPSAR